jgi:hypothetical protein
MRVHNIFSGVLILLIYVSCHQLIPLEPQNLPSQIPKNIFPAHDTTDIQTNITFIWSGGDPNKQDTVIYDFYLKAENPEPELIASSISDTFFQYSSLNYNTRYYWKIVARDQKGESVSSPVWSFSTKYEHNNPPNIPTNPQPANGVTSLSIEDLTLQWTGGDPDSFSLVMYDIYFGEDAKSMNLISESQSDTFYTLGVLEFNMQYFWKVIAKDHYGLTAEGRVWSFSTEPAKLIFKENFDSYPTNGYPETAIWTIKKKGADLFITDSISWNDNGKSLCFVDSTEAGNCFLGTRFPARSVGMLEFCCRINSSKDVFGLRLYSQQSDSDRLGPQLSFREGQLQYYDSNYNWQTVTEIDSNTWYKIQLLFDCHQNYYKIFVNEELMADQATWTGSSVPNLDLIYFLTFDNRICERAFLDEISFFSSANHR